jgi:hypothetical protein
MINRKRSWVMEESGFLRVGERNLSIEKMTKHSFSMDFGKAASG